jgi:hypothetical protein
MRLEKYGYGAKKGKFGYVKISGKNRTKKNVTRNNLMKGGDCGCAGKSKLW